MPGPGRTPAAVLDAFGNYLFAFYPVTLAATAQSLPSINSSKREQQLLQFVRCPASTWLVNSPYELRTGFGKTARALAKATSNPDSPSTGVGRRTPQPGRRIPCREPFGCSSQKSVVLAPADRIQETALQSLRQMSASLSDRKLRKT